jgi:hypothetical protein
LGHNQESIASHALPASIFLISLSVITMFGLGIIHSLNNKYFANQTSKTLYHSAPRMPAAFKSSLVILTFTQLGSHSGIYKLKESSPVLSMDVIINVLKYLDLAKFLIAATR